MSQITSGSSGLPERPQRGSLGRRAVAIAILAVIAYLVLSAVIHVVLTIAIVVVIVAAAIWAARVLL
jgi:hypothetical protein